MEKIKTLFSALYRPKRVLWIGITIIVLMCLFPPWAGGDGRILGHAFLVSDGYFHQPGYADWVPKVRGEIDLVRLVIQCVIVGLITGALLYTLNSKKSEGDGK